MSTYYRSGDWDDDDAIVAGEELIQFERNDLKSTLMIKIP